MTSRRIAALAIVIAAAAFVGCDEGSGPRRSGEAAAMPDTIPGVFSGMFPCDNCPGIDVTLWLRPGGVYLIRQAYRASEAAEALEAHGTGSWYWDAEAAELVLRGRGPERRFRSAGDRLHLQTASAGEHVLTVDRADLAPAGTLLLDGIYSVDSAGRATLAECASGASYRIADGGAHDRLRRRHRSLNRARDPISVQIAARFVGFGTAGEALVVEELLALKQRDACGEMR